MPSSILAEVPRDEEEEGVTEKVVHAEDSRTAAPEVRARAQPPRDRHFLVVAIQTPDVGATRMPNGCPRCVEAVPKPPSCTDCWPGSGPRVRGQGCEDTHDAAPSDLGGRSRHRHEPQCGTGAPGAVAQTQPVQRHAEAAGCTSGPRLPHIDFDVLGTSPVRPGESPPSLRNGFPARSRAAAPQAPRLSSRTVPFEPGRACRTTFHWSNTPCRARFQARRSCSPSSKGIE